MAFRITEVSIKLNRYKEEGKARLQAYASICLDDCFVVRDLKILRLANGEYSIGMPSKKVTDRCPVCFSVNALVFHFCSRCGLALDPKRGTPGLNGNVVLFMDQAHPITQDCRAYIQEVVMDAFFQEIEASKVVHYNWDSHVYDYREEMESICDVPNAIES